MDYSSEEHRPSTHLYYSQSKEAGSSEKSYFCRVYTWVKGENLQMEMKLYNSQNVVCAIDENRTVEGGSTGINGC